MTDKSTARNRATTPERTTAANRATASNRVTAGNKAMATNKMTTTNTNTDININANTNINTSTSTNTSTADNRKAANGKPMARKSPELRQVSKVDSGSRGAGAGKRASEPRKVTPAKRSRRALAIAVAAILAVFGALIFLLNNQSKVIEQSFANAEIQSQINRLTKDNAQRREAISKNMDLETIRREASRLGLQEPLQSQIIEVKQQNTDQIIVNLRGASANGVDPGETDMASIFTNVEGFFKTIR